MTVSGFPTQVQDRALALTRLLLIPALIAVIVGIGLVLSGGGELIDGTGGVVLLATSALAFFIFTRAARGDRHGQLLMQFFFLSLLGRLAAMALKLYLIQVTGIAPDALGYHEEGKLVAAALAAGQLPDTASFLGTRFIELATGLVYFVIGPSFIGGWMVFNLFGLLGMLLHYKAFALALPQSNQKWFLGFIFLAPSILVWTNSVGKDALIAFFLGLGAYGAALIYVRGLRIGPLITAAAGVAGALAIRPHVAALLAAGLFVLVVLRPVRAGAWTLVLRLGIVAACLVGGVLIARTSASFINLEDLSVEGVGQFLEQEQEGSQQGEQAFEGTLPTTPQGVGLALVTVLFRPFPWEASNLFFLVSGAEGLILIGLLLYRFRDVGRAVWDARRIGYLAFALVFVVLFIFFFSTISNFGILVRQRVQVLPFLFVLLAYRRGSS